MACFLAATSGCGSFYWLASQFGSVYSGDYCHDKRRTAGGLVPLICFIVISPILYFIGLAVFAAAVDGAARTTTADRSQETSERSAEVVEVTARQLYIDYDENEVTADNIYKGKTLMVTGRVENISKDLFDGIYITLETGQMFSKVRADGLSEEEAGALRKGQSVTVICRGDGLLLISS